MRIRMASLFVCFVLLLATVWSGAALPASAAEPFADLASWQADLDPALPITEVNTPGTHDSAMFGIGSGLFSGVGFAHNQDKTFAEQFEIGIRYIDGRFCYVKTKKTDTLENIFCCHGGYIPEMNDKDISLKDLLNELNLFLDNHPTEYIFLPFKCESEEDMKRDELNALLASIFAEFATTNSERYLYVLRGQPVPTVEEAKGHIIVTPNSNSGIFSDYCSIANTYNKGTDAKVIELSDVFDINNVREISKTPKIFSPYSENAPKSERVPRLIHTSCYQAIFRTPARTSEDIHDWILGKVKSLDGYAPPKLYAGYYYGIVLFDYVKEDECRLIVELNKPKAGAEPEGQLGEPVAAVGTILGDSENTIATVILAVGFVAIDASLAFLFVKSRQKKANAGQ